MIDQAQIYIFFVFTCKVVYTYTYFINQALYFTRGLFIRGKEETYLPNKRRLIIFRILSISSLVGFGTSNMNKCHESDFKKKSPNFRENIH